MQLHPSKDASRKRSAQPPGTPEKVLSPISQLSFQFGNSLTVMTNLSQNLSTGRILGHRQRNRTRCEQNTRPNASTQYWDGSTATRSVVMRRIGQTTFTPLW